MNRVQIGGWFGKTIAEVCQKPWQFSCWNKNDPNFNVIQNVSKDDPIFKICQQVAAAIAEIAMIFFIESSYKLKKESARS